MSHIIEERYNFKESNVMKRKGFIIKQLNVALTLIKHSVATRHVYAITFGAINSAKSRQISCYTRRGLTNSCMCGLSLTLSAFGTCEVHIVKRRHVQRK